MSSSRLFQSVRPAAENSRSPTVRRWVRGTSSCSEDADRRRRRDGISTKRWRSSDKYGGARPCSDRNTVVASSYWMRSEERNQWNLSGGKDMVPIHHREGEEKGIRCSHRRITRPLKLVLNNPFKKTFCVCVYRRQEIGAGDCYWRQSRRSSQVRRQPDYH